MALALPKLDYIQIQAGSARMVQKLKAWFEDGVLGLESALASNIVAMSYRISGMLPCPLVIQAAPNGFLTNPTSHNLAVKNHTQCRTSSPYRGDFSGSSEAGGKDRKDPMDPRGDQSASAIAAA